MGHNGQIVNYYMTYLTLLLYSAANLQQFSTPTVEPAHLFNLF